ncbi:MAG: carbon storage regulator CsrA [Anaerolineales bacterium]|nr:carbon storage regulator CsrA [Anaerolineales bacterium]MBP6208555.1 carbon storage regulator CsrA [Anaerolineales bacterium]MBP8164169.1 carbon storage regulator CsrA [Anaerolineales bacterium]
MLVISRKINESITIGDNIVVTILDIEGDRIKIGIDAPRELTILRQEVFQAVKSQEKIQELLAEDKKSEKLEQLRKLLAAETVDVAVEEPSTSENPV